MPRILPHVREMTPPLIRSCLPHLSGMTPYAEKATSKCNSRLIEQKKRTSAKFRSLSERSIATTQFHATCRSFAASIKSAVKAGTFKLQPKRIWPNEFTWSGGFYISPDEGKAQLFGATFLAYPCADKGGVVVLEFSFDTSNLQVKDVGTNKSIVDKFRGTQAKLGGAITRFLKKNPVDPPADEGVGNDDSPSANHIPPIPSNAVVEGIPAKALPAVLKTAFEEFKTVDVVAGAGSLAASQRVLIEDAQQVGLPPLKEPFNQVVLVTDKAMKNLKFVKQEDLPTRLAEKQPALVEFLKKKAAANPDA
ncbi:hypothetical protein BDZ89DRAFT_369050 [Hymenopellis radicata]|nr:hypothetical protein BDZ89DRAFT_369050 [Hymenopellis radicata]